MSIPSILVGMGREEEIEKLEKFSNYEEIDPEIHEEIARRYRNFAPEVIEDIARAETYMRKQGLPAIFDYAKTSDPRLLVFFEYLLNRRYPTLAEVAKALGLQRVTLQKWFRIFKEFSPDPEIVRYYEQTWEQSDKSRGVEKKMERESLDLARSFETPKEKLLKVSGDVKKVGEMSEKDEEVVEIPKSILQRLIYASITGNKPAFADALKSLTDYHIDWKKAIEEFIERYGTPEDKRALSSFMGGRASREEWYNRLMDMFEKSYEAYIMRNILPFSSHGQTPLFDAQEERIRRLEEKLNQFLEEFRKREEDERYRKLLERIEDLEKKLLGGEVATKSDYVKALEQKVKELEDQAKFKALEASMYSAISEIKKDLESLKHGENPIDVYNKIYGIIRSREEKLDELRRELEKERNEKLLNQVNALREELESIRESLSESVRDPVSQLKKLGDQIEELEKTLQAIRKGVSPTAESTVREKAMDILEKTIEKLSNVGIGALSSPTAASSGGKIVSLPCPKCGQPVPIPDLTTATQVVCPSCGTISAIQRSSATVSPQK
ncbi:MAG: hypothetical protein QXT14_08105 [Candidatus Bathyarchaeia archaeon]